MRTLITWAVFAVLVTVAVLVIMLLVVRPMRDLAISLG